MAETSRLKVEGQFVTKQLSLLLSHLKDVETGQRGFLLTGDPSYLGPYNKSLGEIGLVQKSLENPAKGNPRRQRVLDSLAPLINAKLAELRETIDLYDSKGFDAAQAMVRTDRGKLLMDGIRKTTFEALTGERLLLGKRNLDIKAATRQTSLTVLLGGGVSTVLLLIAIGFLHREIACREQSEQRFSALVTATSDVVFQMNADWSEMRPMDGRGVFSSTKKASRTWLQDYNHPADQPQIISCIQESIRTNGVFESEHRTLRRDGSWGWTIARAIPIFDSKGEILQWFGAAGDVTGRKRAEEALLQSEARLRSQIEISPLAVVEWGKDFIVTRWAGTAEQMFGWSAAETVGRAFTDLNMIHEDDLTLVAKLMEELISGEKRQASMSNRNVTKDGRVIHCAWHNSMICDAGGRMISALSMAEDITEQMQAAEEIRQFNVTLGQRVTERTMELRDTVAQLEREIAERRRLEREILEVSEREQNRLGQDLHDNLGQQLTGIGMLAEVLAGRLQAESHPGTADAIQLKTYLAESISSSRDLAKSFYPVELERGGLSLALQDLVLRTETVANVSCILTWDHRGEVEKSAEIHLYRIAQEAVINALKHAKPDTIVIDFRTLNGAWTLSITDDGSGYIPPPKGRRTGMGLYILQYRARVIGATIDIRQGEIGGCVVTCTLSGSATAHSGDVDPMPGHVAVL